jgi:hypothetical protein
MATYSRWRQSRTLTVAPDAIAILEDYSLFLQDIWDAAPTSPDDVLSDALRVLVERYREFRQWRQQGGRQHLSSPSPAVRPPSRVPTSSLLIRRQPRQRRRSV